MLEKFHFQQVQMRLACRVLHDAENDCDINININIIVNEVILIQANVNIGCRDSSEHSSDT